MIDIRISKPEEIPMQKELWKRCFGDSDEYIDLFYDKFCTADRVLVVEEDGELNSMVALLDTDLVMPDGSSVRTGYAYALGTNPYIQGKGYARQLLAFADDYLKKRGAKCFTLVPSSPSLHRYFENLGLQECFSARKLEIISTTLADPDLSCTVTPIDSHEYNQIRESNLKDTYHIAYSDELIEFQKLGSQQTGADIYRLEIDGEVGCAAIEYVQKRRLLFKELLISPAKMMKAVELVWSILPATRYHVRTPSFRDGLPGNYIQAFAMIKWYDRELQQKWHNQDAYMGLGFD
ncbi:MAG: GNAT family N-acetyltransferase [Evtepia sp.]